MRGNPVSVRLFGEIRCRFVFSRGNPVSGEIRCRFVFSRGNPVSGEIRCRFVFSGKNDELTPDFPRGLQHLFTIDSPGGISPAGPLANALQIYEKRTEWVAGGRNELAAYVRATRPEMRVVFRGTPAAAGTYTVGADGTPFQVQERQVTLAFDAGTGLSFKRGNLSRRRGEIRCRGGNPVSVHHSGKSGVLQPIMPLDLPVKVRPWELTVYPRSHIRR